MEVYYNSKRMHSTLGYKTPMNYIQGLNKASGNGWRLQYLLSEQHIGHSDADADADGDGNQIFD